MLQFTAPVCLAASYISDCAAYTRSFCTALAAHALVVLYERVCGSERMISLNLLIGPTLLRRRQFEIGSNGS